MEGSEEEDDLLHAAEELGMDMQPAVREGGDDGDGGGVAAEEALHTEGSDGDGAGSDGAGSDGAEAEETEPEKAEVEAKVED